MRGLLHLKCARAQRLVLDQTTWGPTPAAIGQLQQMGIANGSGFRRTRSLRPNFANFGSQKLAFFG